ncbi:MAG: PT domain-containing protein [Candidatus Izemoplasmatales bacterium]|nr:PT domain-containing protein [Candidatus Izemoplasmatales bacterium]
MAMNLPPVPNLSGFRTGAFAETLTKGLSSLGDFYLKNAIDTDKVMQKATLTQKFFDIWDKGEIPTSDLIAQAVASDLDVRILKETYDVLNNVTDPQTRLKYTQSLYEYLISGAEKNVPVEQMANFVMGTMPEEVKTALGGEESLKGIIESYYPSLLTETQRKIGQEELKTRQTIQQMSQSTLNTINSILNDVTKIKQMAQNQQNDFANRGIEVSLEDILDYYKPELLAYQKQLEELGVPANLLTNAGIEAFNNYAKNLATVAQKQQELETQQRQIGIESTKWGIERTKAEIQRLKTLDEQRAAEEGKVPAQTQWKYGKVGRTFWGVGAIDDPIDSALYSASVPLGEDLIRKVQEGELDTPEGNLDIDKFKREWAIAATAIQDPSPYLNMATAGVNELNSLLQQKYGVDLATLDRQINPQAYQEGKVPPYIQLLQAQPVTQPTTQPVTQPTAQPTAPTPTPEDLKQNLINTFVQNVSAAPREKIQAVIVELNTPTSGGYQELINRGLTPQDIQELLRRLEQILAQSR